MSNQFSKDPVAVLDYSVNWATWLGSDTISTSTWDVPPGITKDSDTNTTTAATIWLSGGSLGQNYRITNRIVTVAGRTDERTIYVNIVDK